MRVERPGLAIVGASAAGLAAAIAAARGGADVLLIEAKPAVGEPAAPAIVGFDHLWPAPIAPPESTVRRRLPGVRLRGPSGRGPFVDAPLRLFHRDRLDRHLARAAEEAGARVLTDVGPVEARADRALVARDLEVRPRLLLFADGARSQAARFLRATRDPGELRWGAVLELRAPDAPERALTLTVGAHAPGGRSQANPLEDGRVAHWTFFRGDPARAEAIARRALALDAQLSGWPEPEARFVGVAPDPVYTVPGRLVGDGVLVAGGAAGQGGLEVGLASGWMAGEQAARALAVGRTDAGALRPYERAWRARYQKGYERLRALTDALARLTDAELAALTEAWDGARLPPAPSLAPLLARPAGALAVAKAAFLAHARS